MSALPPALSAAARRIGLEDVGLAEEGARERLQAALDDATALTLSEVSPALADRWTLAAPPIVHVVILAAARRAYENPRGLRTETLGERTVGLTDTSGVFLTARERWHIRREALGTRARFIGSTPTPSAYH